MKLSYDEATRVDRRESQIQATLKLNLIVRHAMSDVWRKQIPVS